MATILDVLSGNKTTEAVAFEMESCCNCGIPFMMPSYHRKRLMNNPGESFFCPNGHGQHYTGKSEAQKLKEELERTKQRAEASQSELADRLLDEINEKKKLQRKLKRVEKGVCPCCNKTFINLQRHMETKHPKHSL